jgi:hypothetical protein
LVVEALKEKTIGSSGVGVIRVGLNGEHFDRHTPEFQRRERHVFESGNSPEKIHFANEL